jgi:hypothetical protein
MLLLKDAQYAQPICHWIQTHFQEIKKTAEAYSNHALLLEINAQILEHCIHLHFVYTTGDAPGQNMTTTCTWHGLLFLVDQLSEHLPHCEFEFIIEGNGAKKFDRYDRRSAIRSLLDAQFDKYGINNYERFNETSETTSINFESAQPQVFIPDGGWKKSFEVNDIYFYNNEYRLISDYMNMVKIKSNSNTEFTLLVDDEAFTVDLENLIKKHMKTGDYYIKIPNNELVFRFKNNQTECALVLNKIRIERESEETNTSNNNAANSKVWKLNELNGTLYLK